MTSARRFQLAADLFVAVIAGLSILVLIWVGQYLLQSTSATVTGIEIYNGVTGQLRTEKMDGKVVAHSKDRVVVSLRFENLPASTFRSDKVIVDCDLNEYTVHSTVKQIKSASPGENHAYGIAYDVPYVSCQGDGIMFTRVEVVDRFNLFMTIFPVVVESNRFPMYFVR
jgi:hypothetical protein